ncbi:MAG TPA: tRNA (adenosine(37)-N6)-dimethylallyltransferase MiaA [Mycobacteriales bacterium]|nr:tRNA (adenosine(37)-N6)-dimethylallyltransferase MiaA [Mycobacteriales bacterium]
MSRVVAVVGPTAAGKSELAVELARRLDGEIVNADSMQLYRGMDVGTAKLAEPARRGVPHHLLDLWDVTQTASVADYQRLARAAIDAILARGRTALLVGGSGLYVRAVLDPLEFPGTDPAIRARLEGELAHLGAATLHTRLAVLDPAAAGGILPSNGRRIVRALEVVELTGRPYTATMPAYAGRDDAGPAGAVPAGARPAYRGWSAGYTAVRLGLDRPDLDERIGARVDLMWSRGLVEEVRTLLAAGIRDGLTASRALGYQQVLAQLAGRCTEAEARAETCRATRRFARRQRSWFRRDPGVVWLDAAAPDLLTAALDRLGAAG